MRSVGPMLVCGLLLVACGGSPAVHYHALPTPDGEAGRPASLGAPIVVGPVRVPAFLSRPYIAWRAGDSRLDYDELHRWGSSLEEEVLRALVEHLAHRLPGRGVLAWPTQVPAERALRVAVDIDRLDVVRGGTSRLRAHFVVRGADEKPLRVGAATAEATMRGGGPAAVVATYGALVEALAADIAAQVEGR